MAFWRKTTVEKEALPEHIPIVAVRELGNVHKAPYEPEGLFLGLEMFNE